MLGFFILYYFIGLLFLAIFFGIGFVLLKTFSGRVSLTRHKTLFASIFLGIVISVTIFSIFVTRFRTISLGFLLIFALLIPEMRRFPIVNKMAVKDSFFSLKKFAVFALVYFIFYLWEAIFLFKAGSFPFVLPHNDFIFSSNVSASLIKTGYENFFMEGNLYNPAYHFMIPYHYFEIWVNSFIVFFTGANNLLTLMLCVFPIFYFAAWMGIVSLFEHFVKDVNWKEYLLSFLLLFLGGLIVELKQSEFFYNLHALAPLPMELATKKYAAFYVFIVAGLLLIINKKIVPCALIILSLSFVSITAFPAIFAGTILFILLNSFLKLMDKRTAVRLFFYLVIISAFIGLVYFYFNKSPFGLVFTNQNTSITSKLLSAQYLKTFFHVVAGSATETALLYLPFLVLGLLVLKRTGLKKWSKEYKIGLLLFTAITASALFIWALLWEMSNAAGFYASSLCYLNILLIFLFIFYYKENYPDFSPAKRLLLTGFIVLIACRLCLAFYYNWDKKVQQEALYSDQYVNEIANETGIKNLNPYGVSLMDYNKYNNLFSKNTFFIRLGQYLKLVSNLSLTTNINIITAPLPQDTLLQKQEEELIQLSVFHQFVEDQKKNNRFVSLDQSQLDFIDKYHIQYVIADQGVELSSLLQKRVRKEIADPVSGERFILLNE